MERLGGLAPAILHPHQRRADGRHIHEQARVQVPANRKRSKLITRSHEGPPGISVFRGDAPRALLVTALALLALAATGRLGAQAQPTGALQGLTAPKPGVPEVFTLTGEFVRMAYNNEGYAVLGYRMAQNEVGNPWVLLNVGVTVRQGVKDYTLKREHFTLQIPDGRSVPLATQKEYMEAGGLPALNKMSRTVHDSINYFPPGANRPCPIKFYADSGGPGLAWDQVDLSEQRACMGRLFFNVPGGIQPGQYWLNVKFASSVVQVPFRVFTKEEEKAFRKQWEDLKKAHDESYK